MFRANFFSLSSAGYIDVNKRQMGRENKYHPAKEYRGVGGSGRTGEACKFDGMLHIVPNSEFRDIFIDNF